MCFFQKIRSLFEEYSCFACMYVLHTAVPGAMGAREGIRPLELESEFTLSCHVGTRSWTESSGTAASALTSAPPLPHERTIFFKYQLKFNAHLFHKSTDMCS